jgi:hypothetical protein
MPTGPMLWGSGDGWNADGMHQGDVHPRPGGGWFACVDGLTHSSPPEHWVHVAFRNGINMEGYTIRAARPIHPGDRLMISFYWTYGTNSPSTNIALFVHAEGEDLRFQGDHLLPAEEDMTRVTMTVPTNAPGGDYRLRVGLYDVTTGENIPLRTRFRTQGPSVILPTRLTVSP